jgi:hypothetical protein
MTLCKIPPQGWWCSREAGHEGPCAARPVNLEAPWNQVFYYPGEVEIVDLPLRPGELLTGINNLGGRCYVFTNERIFNLQEKKRPWIVRLWRKIWR